MLDSNYQPGVDVVVCNYHTMDDLEGFVMSYGHDIVESSLYVVNVEETKEEHSHTRKLLSKIDDPTHLWFDFNAGYSKACNLAASKGNREIIALFNADTQLYDDTLSKCHAALMANSEWGVLGPLQVNSRGKVTHGGIFGTPDAPTQRAWMRTDTNNYRDVREAVSVMGSAFFIKRSVWDELTNCPVYRADYPDTLGAFLETPHYYEETYCAYHAREHGHKVVYYGKALMEHEWHQASPVGYTEKMYFKQSRDMFRRACDSHNILHD